MRFIFAFIFFFSSQLGAQSYKSTIDSLCDPSFYGRGYYRSGDSIAAKYLERQFERIGLEKFNTSFLQPFTFQVNSFPSEVSLKLNGRPLKVGVDFIPDPAGRSVHGTYSVFVFNKEILHDRKKLKTLDTTDFTKRIVVIDQEGFDEKKNKSSKSVKELLTMIRAGMFNNPASIVLDEKLTFGVSTFQSHPVLHFKKGITLTSGDTLDVSIKSELIEEHTAYNVTGFVKGTQYPDSFLFVTAHYDHLGSIGGQAVFRGANDNASGVALMLHLSEMIKSSPLPCSVAFIAFAGEEAGLVGSSHFTEQLLVKKEKIGFVINFDIAGTGNEGIMVVNGTELNSAFERLNAINDSGVKISPVKKRGQAAISDHYRFSELGIPAFYIYTLGGSKAYHDIYDVPGNLTFDVFEKLSSLIYSFYSVPIH